MLQNLMANVDMDLLIRIGIGIVGLIVLILVFNWAMGSIRRAGRRKSRARRLFVLDELMVDDRRRLLLIQRDDVQHLILVGGPNELVVETGIDEPASLRPVERNGSSAGRYRPGADVEPLAVSRPVVPAERPLQRVEPAPKPGLFGRLGTRGGTARSADKESAATPAEDDLQAVEPAESAPPKASRPPVSPRAPDEPLIAVKVDPRFAEMADPLEASMRRPQPRPAPAPASTAPMAPVRPAPPSPLAAAPGVAAAERPASLPAEPVRDVLRVESQDQRNPFEGLSSAPAVRAAPPPAEDPFASIDPDSSEIANLLNRRPIR
ncbi:flagellar biosynthetic protein FliO [Ancylobacter sp. 6x-1]|uniref:Flagellar biosynthetic protein FliO n=1 Tax=Ancylobacter crimeensis TaxID=2579147 RepID=A0ABT0D6G1_9HYPH|nr:flagellar biosynthetic protein FliO [Ancylobacter crimeensis]MCK0195537.1 flagellar biosynthetic protein FliO [Ancylobacter crimeensis]